MPKLILKRKAEVLTEFALRGANATYRVGSDPGNDLVITDKLVSMTHLNVERQGNQYFVRDLKSAFGTLVNGEPITSKIEIRDGDVIQIGDHTLIFKNPLESEPPEPKSKPRHSIEEFWGDIKDSVFTPPPSNGESVEGDVQVIEQAEAVINDGARLSSVTDIRPDENPSQEASPTPQVEVVEKSPYYFLTIYGPYLGKKYQLNFGETRIGRDVKLNDIVLRQNKKGEVDPSISRRHATVSFHDSGFFLTDKRSQSRTYVNQQRLAETDEVQLVPNDEIEIVSDQQSTIFRFVAEGNWDFNPPHKAGEWYIRYRQKAMDAMTVFTLLLGAIVGFQAARAWRAATERPEPFRVELQQFARSEAEASIDDPAASGSAGKPVVRDFNGDRYVDFAYTQSNGVLAAFDGRQRRRLWQASGIVLDPAQPLSVADLNGDRLDDLVVITGDGRLAGIDGLYGAEMWTSPIFENSLIGPAAVGDFDRDGLQDVAMVMTDDKLQIGHSRVNNLDWVEIDLGVASRCAPTAADLSGDGTEELIIPTESGLLLIYNGVERRISETIDINEALNKAKGSFDQVYEVHHPVAVADLSGDGKLDMVVATTRAQILCLDGASRRTLWWAEAVEGIGAAQANGSSSLALADIDKDERPDVVLAQVSGLFAFRGSRHDAQREQSFWESLGDSQTLETAPIALVDFNRDRAADVIFVQNGQLRIHNGLTGETLWESGSNAPLLQAKAAPLVADFGKNGYLDVMLPGRGGDAHLFATNRRVKTARVLWGQLYATAGNASLAIAEETSGGKHMAMLIMAIALPLAAVAGNVFARRRRRAFAII
jgi:pSer/pThr/pTyr-binding forkhead associated (FHA) protein